MGSKGRTSSVLAAVAAVVALGAILRGGGGAATEDVGGAVVVRTPATAEVPVVVESQSGAASAPASSVARDAWAPVEDPESFAVRLVDRRGAPLAGREIELGEESGPWRIADASPLTAAFATTNADGEVRIAVRSGDVRRFLVRFPFAHLGKSGLETWYVADVAGGEKLDPAVVRAPGPGAARIVLAPAPAWTARLVDREGNIVVNGGGTFSLEVAAGDADVELERAFDTPAPVLSPVGGR